jgi:lipoprotein-anchoring transpeptidase ErfK/SrfK
MGNLKKFITLAIAGLLLFSVEGAWAQREVKPPAVPPILEGQRPLPQTETREPAAPKQTQGGTAKAKTTANGKTQAKAGKKSQKKAAVKKETGTKTSKVVKKKSHKKAAVKKGTSTKTSKVVREKSQKKATVKKETGTKTFKVAKKESQKDQKKKPPEAAPEHAKMIWIDQLKQVGAAYEDGKKVMEFPVLTGDAETTTDPGTYLVQVKQEDYYSRKYETPMPYSIFFNYEERAAIHGGEVPSPQKKIGLATHGCVHVEQPYIERLYDWTEAGRTTVVIMNRRTQD